MIEVWITTSEAIRLAGMQCAPKTFRRKFVGLIPWRKQGIDFLWRLQEVLVMCASSTLEETNHPTCGRSPDTTCSTPDD